MGLRGLHNLSKSHLASLHNSPKYNLVILAKSAKSDLGIPEHRKITMGLFFLGWCRLLFLNSHGAILCLDRAEFLFLSFGCMMFFNFGVGCFVFSRANLGLRCSPAGERTEAVEYKYVFLKSVTFVFGCVLVRKQ
jgi:hypothetical protein